MTPDTPQWNELGGGRDDLVIMATAEADAERVLATIESAEDHFVTSVSLAQVYDNNGDEPAAVFASFTTATGRIIPLLVPLNCVVRLAGFVDDMMMDYHHERYARASEDDTPPHGIPRPSLHARRLIAAEELLNDVDHPLRDQLVSVLELHAEEMM
jgi:hypothetical protein